MEAVIFLSIIIALFSILVSCFAIRRVKKQIAEITDALIDVKNGNGNRRILSATNELVAPLAYEINEIVVSYESRLSTVRQTEETNRQLMTSLSHDVRTPLTTLIGYLDAAHKGIVTGKDRDDYIETARRKAHDLKEYIDVLFDWFKLNSNEFATLFFPIIIALIAGYIITREYTDDTMKNILTIPIPYKQLLSGKLLILLLLTISFSLIGCVIALVINIIVGFPGVHFGNLLNMFIRVTGANIGIYISVLPIILIFCCSANNFLGGVALAFVYGYFGTFEGTLLNYYPIKASMILVDPTCGAEYGYTYHIFPAFITIVLTFLISMIILANKKKEPGTLTVGKKKKAVRKKGW